LKETPSGPIKGVCPPRTSSEMVCCKCPNDDEHAFYDFELMLLLVRNGNLMLMTSMIPLANGELLIADRTVEYSITSEDKWVKRFKLEKTSAGVVAIRKEEVSEVYTHFTRKFFASKTKIRRFGLDRRLIEEKDMTAFKFPSLPSQPSSAATNHALELAEAHTNDRIRFSDYARLEDGDYEVDGGEELNPETEELPLGVQETIEKPPGIYIELVTQQHPPLVATVVWLVEDDGRPTLLGGTYCRQVSYAEVRQQIFKKKKKSWFRTKTRISIVTKALRSDKGECFTITIPAGGRP